jgi:hypothetical protein
MNRSAGATLILVAALALCEPRVSAADAVPVSGQWVFAVEQLSLRMTLAQRGNHITGTLQNPHGNPIALKGTFEKGRLKLTGASQGGEFAYRLSALAIVKPDGSLAGILLSNAGDMTWTAIREP